MRKDDPKTHEIIMELKAHRDSIVHLKERPGTPTAYQHIFASALDWNYKKYLDATAELINYLIPCTIELCACSRSY